MVFRYFLLFRSLFILFPWLKLFVSCCPPCVSLLLVHIQEIIAGVSVENLSPVFSSKSLKFQVLYLSHFELTFASGVKWGWNLTIFAWEYPVFLVLLKRSFLHCVLFKVQLTYMHRVISGLSVLFHWAICPSLCQYIMFWLS